MTETFAFQAEVSQLLSIVVHALYSNQEIFLRELISNAYDACERLRYLSLTQHALIAEGRESAFRIVLTPDKATNTLTISDNGIGMNREELVQNLGTVARSGTVDFLRRVALDQEKEEANLSAVGQFGVGFYSAFMVAESVEVITCRADNRAMEKEFRWISDGKDTFIVDELPSVEQSYGTKVILHLRQDALEYLEPQRLRYIVKTYSDYINVPIVLRNGEIEETINTASALWLQPPNNVTEEQYRDFYRQISRAFDEPWLTIHYKAEGTLEYTSLLFIPSTRTPDLFHQDRKHHVHLYMKRVFVTSNCADLLPAWLRFLRGVVDSQDLPLNVSREVLQRNTILEKVRNGLVRHILADLKVKARDVEEYSIFWENFGAVLKEGLYEDPERKNDIIELSRFRTTNSFGTLISLEEYVERMKDGQDTIYYIVGDNADTLTHSPHLEGFYAKGVEVLLLVDPIDGFWPSIINEYKGKLLASAVHTGIDLDRIKVSSEQVTARNVVQEPAIPSSQLSLLTETLKRVIGQEVKDVRISSRLTETPVCLVSDQDDMSLHMEQLLRQNRQINHTIPRILELNPKHGLIRKLANIVQSSGDATFLQEIIFLLLDQARIISGEQLPDPTAFARRISTVMERDLLAR